MMAMLAAMVAAMMFTAMISAHQVITVKIMIMCMPSSINPSRAVHHEAQRQERQQHAGFSMHSCCQTIKQNRLVCNSTGG
jgi:hypothetical protein